MWRSFETKYFVSRRDVMQVREIMTNRVIVIDPSTTIRDAAHRMRDHHIGALPACESNRLIGIVTDRDIAVRAVADARSPGNTTVRQVMSEGVVYCFEDDDAEQARQTMAKHRIRRLPVLNRDKHLAGIVTLTISCDRCRRSRSERSKTYLNTLTGRSAEDRF
jgi:CBS domain-containing protein